MPSRCSLCNGEGHNIRTCRQDRELINDIHYLYVDIAEDIAFRPLNRFTEEYRVHIETRIRTFGPRTIRAFGVQYCHLRLNTPLEVHLSSIVDRLFAEVEHVIRVSPEQRDEWYIYQTGLSMTDFIDSILQREQRDREAEELHDRDTTIIENKYPAYEIILKPVSGELDTTLECVVCQEETHAGRFHKTQCGHSFCHDCISKHLTLKHFDRAKCPLCRAEIISLEATDQQCYDSMYCNFSEMGALMKDCEKLWEL